MLGVVLLLGAINRFWGEPLVLAARTLNHDSLAIFVGIGEILVGLGMFSSRLSRFAALAFVVTHGLASLFGAPTTTPLRSAVHAALACGISLSGSGRGDERTRLAVALAVTALALGGLRI